MTAVDVTYDGHWILATSDYYLCVVPSQFKVIFLGARARARTPATCAAASSPMHSMAGI